MFNEWYARDSSKKRRISNKIKGNAGEPMGQPPYGYIKDPDNSKRWIVDEEAATVVHRIYQMTLDGYGLSENTAMLTLSIIYPKVTLHNNPSAQDSINHQIQKQVDDFCQHATGKLYQQAIANYQDAQKQGFPFHPYDAISKYKTTYNRNCYFSVYRDLYEYTGGAHGNTVRSSDTWNLNDGKNISLSSLFPAGQDYQTLLTEQILKQADEQYQQNSGIYFADYRELITKYFDEENYYFTHCGIAIYYPLYTIAPYSTGIVVFTIPYTTIGWWPHC